MVCQLIAFATAPFWFRGWMRGLSFWPCICGEFLVLDTHIHTAHLSLEGTQPGECANRTVKPIIKQSPTANVPSGKPGQEGSGIGDWEKWETHWILTALAALIGPVRTIGLRVAPPAHRYAESIVACEVRGWTGTWNRIDDGIMVTRCDLTKKKRGNEEIEAAIQSFWVSAKLEL